MYYITLHDIGVVFDITLAKEGFENRLTCLRFLFLFVG